MDCGRVNINAGDRTAFELPGGRRRQGQRATRRSRPIKPGRKTLGGDFSILRIEKCAEDDDLAGEFAMKKIRVVAFNAGVQIGERKRLNIVAATLEIESQCVWHRSEEHTSELQSPDHLVCRLLLEKKKMGPKCRIILHPLSISNLHSTM